MYQTVMLLEIKRLAEMLNYFFARSLYCVNIHKWILLSSEYKRLQLRHNQQYRFGIIQKYDMTRFNLLFALFLAVFCVVEINAQRRCPPNEEWRSCGTACPPTCRNPYARACTMVRIFPQYTDNKRRKITRKTCSDVP
uniref:AMCI_2 protein n=1 Tax=Fopius arisanus TaxID=64838 RepID=A0A0C9QX56_9HYME